MKKKKKKKKEMLHIFKNVIKEIAHACICKLK